MSQLHVALQDGFDGDRVVIRVNLAEMYRQDHVKTRTQLGYADAVDLDVDAGPVNVEVALPLRGLSTMVTVPAGAPVYLGVSVERGRLEHRLSTEPFGYV